MFAVATLMPATRTRGEVHYRRVILPELATILIAAGIVGTIKNILLGVLAIVNGVLAVLATLAIWKSYLVTGLKILFTLLVVVPIAGVVIYMLWGQKKVAEAV